jgi:hypothetical protein
MPKVFFFHLYLQVVKIFTNFFINLDEYITGVFIKPQSTQRMYTRLGLNNSNSVFSVVNHLIR